MFLRAFQSGFYIQPLTLFLKELAYHGDVINTSARIQGECNKHNVHLLISEVLLKDLRIGSVFSSRSLGTVLLKGKHEEIRIHALSNQI